VTALFPPPPRFEPKRNPDQQKTAEAVKRAIQVDNLDHCSQHPAGLRLSPLQAGGSPSVQ
jgi:hypothetical protein